MGIKADIYVTGMLYAVGKEREARLFIDDYNKFMRAKVVVRDRNNPKAKAKVVTNVPIGRRGAYAVLTLLKRLKNENDEVNYQVLFYRPKWVNDKRTDEKELAGAVEVGKKKDKEGNLINYIAVIGTDEKKYAFKLLPTPYINIIKNGKVLTPTEVSEIWLDTYIKNLEDMLSLFLDTVEGEDPDMYKKGTEAKVLVNEEKDTTAADIEKVTSTDTELDDILGDI